MKSSLLDQLLGAGNKYGASDVNLIAGIPPAFQSWKS